MKLLTHIGIIFHLHPKSIRVGPRFQAKDVRKLSSLAIGGLVTGTSL